MTNRCAFAHILRALFIEVLKIQLITDHKECKMLHLTIATK